MFGLNSNKNASKRDLYRVIYRSPYAGGTEISEPGTREQCMAAFDTSVAKGWMRHGNGRRMVVISEAEYQRRLVEAVLES